MHIGCDFCILNLEQLADILPSGIMCHTAAFNYVCGSEGTFMCLMDNLSSSNVLHSYLKCSYMFVDLKAALLVHICYCLFKLHTVLSVLMCCTNPVLYTDSESAAYIKWLR